MTQTKYPGGKSVEWNRVVVMTRAIAGAAIIATTTVLASISPALADLNYTTRRTYRNVPRCSGGVSCSRNPDYAGGYINPELLYPNRYRHYPTPQIRNPVLINPTIINAPVNGPVIVAPIRQRRRVPTRQFIIYP